MGFSGGKAWELVGIPGNLASDVGILHHCATIWKSSGKALERSPLTRLTNLIPLLVIASRFNVSVRTANEDYPPGAGTKKAPEDSEA